jgi:transposase InsO family protein
MILKMGGGEAVCGRMQVRMQNAEGLTPEQIEEFLKGSQGIAFAGQSRAERYEFVQRVLVAQEYASQRSKKRRGAIRAYLSKVTGLSLPQLTRLIRQYRQEGVVQAQPYQRHRFGTKYQRQDVDLLAQVDQAHGWLSGPATVCILKREHEQFGKAEYARLAGISVAHLYNLRRSAGYRNVAADWTPTQPSAVAIGERRKPDPQGRLGFLRIDTVHQGDWQGVKGVYHINAVDAITQWQVVGCVERINEHFLLPVLEAMLHQFPFSILGFHSDNGSEYVNYQVAKLLKHLLIEFTKSRAQRTQDNALVEGKNGAIIRKHIGYGHIPAEHAEAVQKFYTAQFNPYLNFHRPCGFATLSLDARGKRRRQYPREDYATPYEKLKSLENAERYLKPGQSWAGLERIAQKLSDTECARKMMAAKQQLLRRVKIESLRPPSH